MDNLALSNLRLILLYSLLVHFVDCVDEIAKEEILHASSYAVSFYHLFTNEVNHVENNIHSITFKTFNVLG